jgi:hypothetical protein
MRSGRSPVERDGLRVPPATLFADMRLKRVALAQALARGFASCEPLNAVTVVDVARGTKQHIAANVGIHSRLVRRLTPYHRVRLAT